MKLGFSRYGYKAGLVVCLLLLIGPKILWLLLWSIDLIYLNDCEIVARCENVVFQIAGTLALRLFFLGPFSMLLGAVGILILATIWGARGCVMRSDDSRLLRYTKYTTGLVCGGIWAYLLYIPSGPDPCSRVLTDTQYENCLESAFSEGSFADSRQWLVQHGYRLSTVLEGGFGERPASGFENGEIAFQYDKWFHAFREHAPSGIVPYGTNFHRMFVLIGPAPEQFKLDVFGWDEGDRIVRVQVQWGFSFL